MHVVSSCPHCGAPIYGPKEIEPGAIPAVTRSCGCVPGVIYPRAPWFVPVPYVVPETPTGPWWTPMPIPIYQGPWCATGTTPGFIMNGGLSDGGRV